MAEEVREAIKIRMPAQDWWIDADRTLKDGGKAFVCTIHAGLQANCYPDGEVYFWNQGEDGEGDVSIREFSTNLLPFFIQALQRLDVVAREHFGRDWGLRAKLHA